jgi:succinate dehydrogenase / fumarate reductase membrane anchor subunit
MAMVTNISSFGRSGLYDWVTQRVTAVILAGYTFCLMGTFLFNPDLDYQQWRATFESFPMRFFTLLAVLSLCAHGWIGMWTIATDYLTPAMVGKRATVFRFLFQVLCALLALVYLVWTVQILWGM